MIPYNPKKWFYYIFLILVAIGIPLLIIYYTLTYHPHSLLRDYILSLASVAGICFVVGGLQTSRYGRYARTVALLFAITYILAECTVYVLIGFGIIRSDIGFWGNSLFATNSPLAVYDTISGYRGLPGNHRFISIANDVVEIDHFVHVNQQGWFSKRNYFLKKNDSSIKRYLILGDSYSSALATGTPWCDMAQELLDSLNPNKIELYNFSLEGTGIVNWHRIFKYEILPHYQFDGIIIASASERNAVPDLDRKFFMFHSTSESTYMQMADLVSTPPPLSFPYDSAVPWLAVYPDSRLNEIKNSVLKNKQQTLSFAFPKTKLNFLTLLYEATDAASHLAKLSENAMAYRKPYEDYYSLAGKPYKMEYFNERYRYGFMLKEIITTCRQMNKDVILVNIPDYENARDFVNNKPVICRQELQFLSDYYGVTYFDGFGIFENKDESFVTRCFYKEDMHWNTYAASLFARQFADSIGYFANVNPKFIHLHNSEF